MVLASAARAGVVLNSAAAALSKEPQELDALARGAKLVDGAGILRRLESEKETTLPQDGPGSTWLGLLEALAGRTLEAAGRVEQLLGSGERLVAFGGGSRSRPWMQAKARIATMPVLRALVREAVARGAALFAGVAAGWWPGAETAPRPELELIDKRASSG